MRHRYIRSIVFIMIVLVVSVACSNNWRSSNKQPVIKPDDLRMAIINSIKNPFAKTDTLIVDHQWAFCGNSKPEEVTVVFDLKMDSTLYRRQLSNITNQTIVPIKEYEAVMDTVLKYKFKNQYPESLWDSCRVGKTVVSIHAEQISPTKVKLYEQYMLNDKSQSVTKEFNFTANRWTYHLIMASNNDE